MALTIDGATVGFDSNNMAAALDEIHAECVEKAKSELNTRYNDLVTAVDDCWVGISADTFKGNLKTDIEKICNGLDGAYDELVNAFNNAISGMRKVDEEVVQKR